MFNQKDQIVMGNGHIDELALLLYCNITGLKIDEKVAETISTNAFIIFQSLCAYLSKEEQENVLRNYTAMMQQDLLDYEECYQQIHSNE